MLPQKPLVKDNLSVSALLPSLDHIVTEGQHAEHHPVVLQNAPFERASQLLNSLTSVRGR